MIVVIDNYDSFTFNLVQFLGSVGQHIQVFRNDKITLEGLEALQPDHIVISPGPGWPAQAGICIGLIRKFAGKIPILGVCLGHQAIGEAYGGKIVHAPAIMHGKADPIFYRDNGIFKNVRNPFKAGRYHSLVIDRKTLPDALKVTAWSADDLIMAVQHKTDPVIGVQFHPESILTEDGMRILENFLSL